MHQLSIVIVNYRVPLLLGQCLSAVAAAIEGIDAEVWVVDNASADGSVEYLRQRYPWVNYIENEENFGFSKANNIAIERSQSEYVLLLNPDTIIAEDTLTHCLDYMRTHERCGAIGVKMHNIQGKYLRESKRGFPTTWVSFCKLSGLARFLPKSKWFAGYYMGHLSEFEAHSVEVLSGAFMMVSAATIRQIGLLDERFFMYGEDIDWSYRVVLSGAECHYVPTKIIHYKGESSILNSAKYIRSFYGAMELFYDKYHSTERGTLSRWLIGCSIRVLSLVATLLSFFGSSRHKSLPPKPEPVALPLSSLPERESHLLIDARKHTYKEIIDAITQYPEQRYTYHLLNREGEVISPRR